MTTISRRLKPALLPAACWLLAGLAFAVPAAAQRPNILFIMTDDHAAQAIGAYGSRVNQTPNLDRIANEGMRMDRVFATNSHGLYDKRFMYEESLRMPFLVRWPAAIRPGAVSDAIGINCDVAPTFLELAGLATPTDMQGRSFVPIWTGKQPRDWRQAMYYRYSHDPGDHDTRAHYGIRTNTHKLIYYWKKDQWECYDLVADPREMRSIYDDPAAQQTVARLKQQLRQLKKELKDDDRFADKLPTDSSYVQPPPPKKR